MFVKGQVTESKYGLKVLWLQADRSKNSEFDAMVIDSAVLEQHEAQLIKCGRCGKRLQFKYIRRHVHWQGKSCYQNRC